MEEQYGEAHRIWWLHLQDMSVQASKHSLAALQALTAWNPMQLAHLQTSWSSSVRDGC